MRLHPHPPLHGNMFPCPGHCTGNGSQRRRRCRDVPAHEPVAPRRRNETECSAVCITTLITTRKVEHRSVHLSRPCAYPGPGTKSPVAQSEKEAGATLPVSPLAAHGPSVRPQRDPGSLPPLTVPRQAADLAERANRSPTPPTSPSAPRSTGREGRGEHAGATAPQANPRPPSPKARVGRPSGAWRARPTKSPRERGLGGMDIPRPLPPPSPAPYRPEERRLAWERGEAHMSACTGVGSVPHSN